MPESKRPSLTPERLDMLREHIPYRVWMLRSTHALIQTGIFAGPVQNALIESFAIHARALVEFYRCRRGTKASHFTNSSYQAMSGELEAVAKRLHQRISEAIAHVEPGAPTASAEKLNLKNWTELLGIIEIETRRFVDHLPPDLRAIWGQRHVT